MIKRSLPRSDCHLSCKPMLLEEGNPDLQSYLQTIHNSFSFKEIIVRIFCIMTFLQIFKNLHLFWTCKVCSRHPQSGTLRILHLSYKITQKDQEYYIWYKTYISRSQFYKKKTYISRRKNEIIYILYLPNIEISMMANSKQTFCCIDINTFNIFNTVQ